MGYTVPRRTFVATLALAALAAAQEEQMGLGSRECPLDISVLWTAEVDSPVYSTPVILPSSAGGHKQVQQEHVIDAQYVIHYCTVALKC